nr:HAMP domain-containing sensor histidine kinase [Nitrosomonas nitrosa]
MKRARYEIKSALPYALLTGALMICIWTFVRSEYYRDRSDQNFSQTYEIQWRTTQIREHLTRIHSDLRLAAVTGNLDTDLQRQIILLDANVAQLLRLEYVGKFLRARDIELLSELAAEIGVNLDPIASGSTDYERALLILPDLKSRMFEISGTAVAHADTLNKASHIQAAASRNRFFFAAALALAAITYAVIHLRGAYLRRRDQHLRWFSAMYAHMTRSRVTALRLFLAYQDEATVRHPEMLEAARDAVQQLDDITLGLSTVALIENDAPRKTFSEIVESIPVQRDDTLCLDIHADAADASVPASYCRLILEELVRNAEAAIGDRADGRILIRATLRRPKLRRCRELNLAVCDNGPGMSEDIIRKAKAPFFSTRGGTHTGLGLAGCAQMVAALKGKLAIASAAGEGTCVTIRMPV